MEETFKVNDNRWWNLISTWIFQVGWCLPMIASLARKPQENCLVSTQRTVYCRNEQFFRRAKVFKGYPRGKTIHHQQSPNSCRNRTNDQMTQCPEIPALRESLENHNRSNSWGKNLNAEKMCRSGRLKQLPLSPHPNRHDTSRCRPETMSTPNAA